MTFQREKLVNVIQGDYTISEDPEAVLTTVLGSCIAVCLSDPQRGIGGMNHFLLPNRDGAEGENVRYGAYAMELLINGLLKQGADRSRLQAKVFGGGKMIGSLQDIGNSNTKFARQFLADEGIPCLAESTGGTQARRIRFWPTTGKVKQLLVSSDAARVEPPKPVPAAPPVADDITLF
ncbi:Chemoreceptor glutamine deamidase CheD [Pelagimonas phthalicica]|uniref:Probable chemoreceptor glutamine deamidase CheD n=1 Tax=Pelagimonas phthalicica TaxID=1037362 RepID=A0A238JH60_9RHOB|nr:chemotaxis protein CheD [Pelagimonas phthalicica]TDS92096.1 chemotaxis protein CheD [Pelagimonas phthalicica]SMX29146.1 Chemoreceptor glutamine deamidase CheD [Pelagimonas phthalicica]